MTFEQNKYSKWYHQLITKRKLSPLYKRDIYCEAHHIIPKSLGGSNDKDNLINLLPREHFIAHLLLTKMVSEKDHVIKMNWAFHRMCFSGKYNSKGYEWNRKRHSSFLRKHHHSKRIEGWNEKMSELVSANWKNNTERKNLTAKKLKEWQINNREEFLSNNLKNAKLGGQAAKRTISTKIEYMGVIYLGWKELYDKTGVSKFLYKKLYLNGYDPVDRIGKNGPMSKGYVLKPLTTKENQ